MSLSGEFMGFQEKKKLFSPTWLL